MMGDELPFPGTSTFHLILVFSLHLMGGAAFFGAMPLDCGPLQVGQFNASPKENPAIATKTKAKNFHSSARINVKSKMEFRNQLTKMGNIEDEYQYQQTSAALVKQMVDKLNK